MTAERDAQVSVDDIITRINDLCYSPTDRREAAIAYLKTIEAGDEATAKIVAALLSHFTDYKGPALKVKVPPDAKPLVAREP